MRPYLVNYYDDKKWTWRILRRSMKYELYSGKYEPTATTAYSIDVRRRLVSRQVQLGNETRKLNATKIAQDRSAKDGKLLHLLLQNSAKASNSTSFCNLHIKISLIMNLQVSIYE